MKDLLLHLFVSIMMFRIGFRFSKLTYNHETWGFYRINFRKPDGSWKYGIADIDFHVGAFANMHGDNEIYRWDSPGEKGHFFMSPTQDKMPPRHKATCKVNGVVMEYSEMNSKPRLYGIFYRAGMKQNKFPDTRYLGYGNMEKISR